MADHDVEMANYHYSSSPELSSLLSDSPSEPGSPSRSGHKNDEIVVNSSSIQRYPLMQQQQQPPPPPPSQPQQPVPVTSYYGVRLTKDGTPRKKPGRKPGTAAKKPADSAVSSPATTAPVSGTEAKPRRTRKPKDPNAPPVQRKRRATIAAAAAASAPAPPEPEAPQPVPDTSMSMPPKVELTSMRMDMDARPTSSTAASAPLSARQPPRQPPLSVVERFPKREPVGNTVRSILNADDSPAPAPITTPGRSGGLGYDPVRSSTSSYDPVRGTMISRNPYGTEPLGSPRGPTQVPNRASASPSIFCLVDSNTSISHSPNAPAPLNHRVSPPPYNMASTIYNMSHPPSPSPAPALRNMASSSSLQHAQPAALKAKTAAPAAASVTVASTATTGPASSAKAAAAKSESNGHKSHSRPPPPSVPGTAKSTASKAATAKSAAQKSLDSKTSTITAASTEKPTASKSSSSTTTSFRDVAMTGTNTSANANGSSTAVSASTAPVIKKFSSILQQERGGKQNRVAVSATSSPKLSGAKEDSAMQLVVPDSVSLPGSETERSILDFGKARPGEEMQAPSIVLHIPLVCGENNKYVNFMRMAEDRYGWDALHPRLAAHRDRKARIAAASAALERNGSGRESGEDMTDDLQSGDEGSNDENGGAADISLAPAGLSGDLLKPVRKKRFFKEDEYDKDDDFVDDSELLWEEQAAASRDGFFVYSGPLVPEEEKPDEGAAPPSKRARGSRTTRGGNGKATTARSTARSTGSGSRSTTTARKPRATKQEKEQREREKADSDKAALSKSTVGSMLAGPSSNLSTSMVVDA